MKGKKNNWQWFGEAGGLFLTRHRWSLRRATDSGRIPNFSDGNLSNRNGTQTFPPEILRIGVDSELFRWNSLESGQIPNISVGNLPNRNGFQIFPTETDKYETVNRVLNKKSN
jgi:hypothetical protein